MPQLQTVDLSGGRQSGTSKFFEGLGQSVSDRYQQQRESDALKDIYQQYQQQGMTLEKKRQVLNSDPRVSPKRRIEETDYLIKESEMNAKNLEALDKKIKEDRARQARINAGYNADLDPTLAKQQYSYQKLNELMGPEGNQQQQAPSQIGGQENQQIPAQEQGPSHENPEDYSDEKIRAIGIVNPPLANLIQNAKNQKSANALKERKLEQEERKHWEKTTGKWVSGQLDKLPDIERAEETANQMKATASKVSGPVNRTWLANQLGAGYDWIKSTEGNIFEAGKKNMFAGAKSIFGSRITDVDTRIYDQGLAGVGRTKAANDLLITQEQSRLKIERARIEEMRKILKENPYMPEFQLREEIEERISPLVNREYNAWRKSLYEAAGTSPQNQEQRTSLTPDKKEQLNKIFGSQ